MGDYTKATDLFSCSYCGGDITEKRSYESNEKKFECTDCGRWTTITT